MEKDIFFTKGKEIELSTLDESLFTFQPPVNDNEIEQVVSKPYNYWRYVGMTLIKGKLFVFSTIILVLLILLAYIVPIGKDVYPTDVRYAIQGPSWEHLFGVGNRGEDFWNTIWSGTKTTITFALILMVFQIVIGFIVGVLWGYGFLHDGFWNWVVRVFSFLPPFVIWILFVYLFGQVGHEHNIWVVVFGVIWCSWPKVANAVKNQVRLITKSNLNLKSITLGISRFGVFTRNILPNVLPILFRFAAYSFPEAIAVDSTLNFFNLGYISNTDITQTSLGAILTTTLAGSNWEHYPHLIIIPTAMIIVVPLTFNYFSRAISRSLNPSTHVR
jgi:oligopeptide transport system permease protein